MTVAVCIATRGRPNQLNHTVHAAHKLAVERGTHFSIALDRDDPEILGYSDVQVDPWRIYSVAAREDSLGAKYNRAMRGANPSATVFVLGVDDAYLSCEGWDKKLLDAASLFEDGIGCIYFGNRSGLGQLPDGMAVTKGWIEKVGFFMPEYFPFWWHDTWVDELARFTGRFVWTDATWAKYGASEVNGHKTTRMREVAWWAKFFDVMRVRRMVQAVNMISELSYPAWMRDQLLSEIADTAEMLEYRNSLVLNRAAEFEQGYGASHGVDAGYERLKRQAEQMLGGAA